jgi:hypothetical protein
MPSHCTQAPPLTSEYGQVHLAAPLLHTEAVAGAHEVGQPARDDVDMEAPIAAGDVIDALVHPPRLWTTDEVATRPSPVPNEHGIYGWHFRVPPAEGLDADRLLYVGYRT